VVASVAIFLALMPVLVSLNQLKAESVAMAILLVLLFGLLATLRGRKR